MEIAFIICVNNMTFFEECQKYIDILSVPDGMTTRIIPVWNAPSMAHGYNQGRKLSDAKYKIYLHQDVFIINRDLIKNLISIFQSDPQIGIIGMIGANEIQNDKITWDRWEYGKVFACNGRRELHLDYGSIGGEYLKTDFVDGMFIATQYDIPWRDDIFDGWHFYDRSICMEYLKHGYITVVAGQKSPWCIHDCGLSGLSGWNKYLEIFLNEYRDYFSENCIHKSIVDEINEDAIQTFIDIARNIEFLINQRKMQETREILNSIKSLKIRANKKIIFNYELLDLYDPASSKLFFLPDETVEEMLEIYTKAKFIYRRLLYQLPVTAEENEFIKLLNQKEKETIIIHNLAESIKRKNS